MLSVLRTVEVGGSQCSRKAMSVMTTSTAPAAPNKCPTLDFVELTGNSFARAPDHRFNAAASALSLRGVPVPCALT